MQREDDKPETVAKRLDVFEAQTMPLVGFYRDGAASRLVRIDALEAGRRRDRTTCFTRCRWSTRTNDGC